MQKDEALSKISEIVEVYFSSQKPEFIPGVTKVPLQYPSYGHKEVIEAIESLLSTWVTMGKKVGQFERIFADYIGVKYGLMVNSGSSANLVALTILTNPLFRNRIPKGSEVITPAITWATTVYPILNVGLKPVFVDVGTDYDIDVNKIESAITDKTKAIMPVHMMGNPCDIKTIMEIAQNHNLFVVEDNCESYGAEVDGKKAGSFGNLSTSSFFISHHITTIEGGMVNTNDEELFEFAKQARTFGWIRDLKNKEEISKSYPNIDPRFLFISMGYNLRPTELQGGFGIHQMAKIEEFIKIRRENADFWNKSFEKFSDYLTLPQERRGIRHSRFCYPITIKPNAPFTRKEMMEFLENKKIETRPVMAGNIVEQPVSQVLDYRVAGDLANSHLVMNNSFFFGNHQNIGKEEREHVANSIEEFMKLKMV
ncbi:MAG: aminotransferase class I/II-fold pyridoxal phosphate-dependent enzyme [Candidatus Aenigmarchaeota archaeon]|nr:aminotransferase class I/II-fold pyridoxal phosphate-dependent enzyme [Candidatus Aenigmarchaeota archaeon]